jgi:hypothetical protein
MFKAYENKSKPDNVETVTKDTAKESLHDEVGNFTSLIVILFKDYSVVLIVLFLINIKTGKLNVETELIERLLASNFFAMYKASENKTKGILTEDTPHESLPAEVDNLTCII